MSLRTDHRAGPPVDPLHRAERLVEDLSGLVSPPDVCLRLMNAIQSPTSSAVEIGRIMAADPNATARLLRIVNSPLYGFRRRVDTVSRAIAIVGTRDLYNLVLAVSAVSTLSKLGDDAAGMEAFWRHSIFCALVARRLAGRCRVLHPERLFVIGLLHDIGRLIITNRLPEVAARTSSDAGGDEHRLWECERAALGFSHATLGALLFRLWHLPEPLQQAVLFHHNPGAAASARLESSIVHLADLLANRSEIGAFCPDALAAARPDPRVWEILGMGEDALDEAALIEGAGLEFAATAGALLA